MAGSRCLRCFGALWKCVCAFQLELKTEQQLREDTLKETDTRTIGHWGFNGPTGKWCNDARLVRELKKKIQKCRLKNECFLLLQLLLLQNDSSSFGRLSSLFILAVSQLVPQTLPRALGFTLQQKRVCPIFSTKMTFFYFTLCFPFLLSFRIINGHW